MIRVRMGPDRLRILGHAGYGRRGEDIVCAAVSALAYALIGVLQEQEKIRELTVRPGYIEVAAAGSFPGAMELVRCGIGQLARQYPQYVMMEEKEYERTAGTLAGGNGTGGSGAAGG